MSGRVLVTGGSGLLGSQTVRAFAEAGWAVTAPTHAEADLADPAAVAALAAARPDLIVNCAAQRRPDRCEAETPALLALNVALPARLARLGVPLIHISTDYVFDGTAAPYETDARRRPLNAYGRQKAAAEEAVEALPHVLILRVPILFGPCRDWRDSAVTVLAANLVAAKGAAVRMDDLAIRRPTFTRDVARQLLALAPHAGRGLAGICHYSGAEPMTKFLMGLTMAPLIGCDPAQCVPDRTPPAVPRPYDCTLSTRRLAQAGLLIPPTPFAAALAGTL